MATLVALVESYTTGAVVIIFQAGTPRSICTTAHIAQYPVHVHGPRLPSLPPFSTLVPSFAPSTYYPDSPAA